MKKLLIRHVGQFNHIFNTWKGRILLILNSQLKNSENSRPGKSGVHPSAPLCATGCAAAVDEPLDSVAKTTVTGAVEAAATAARVLPAAAKQVKPLAHTHTHRRAMQSSRGIQQKQKQKSRKKQRATCKYVKWEPREISV